MAASQVVHVIDDDADVRQSLAFLLSAAGLVEMRPDAQRRIYALRPDPLRGLDLWLARYRGLWEQQFERLDEVLKEMQAGANRTTTRQRRARRKK